MPKTAAHAPHRKRTEKELSPTSLSPHKVLEALTGKPREDLEIAVECDAITPEVRKVLSSLKALGLAEFTNDQHDKRWYRTAEPVSVLQGDTWENSYWAVPPKDEAVKDQAQDWLIYKEIEGQILQTNYNGKLIWNQHESIPQEQQTAGTGGVKQASNSGLPEDQSGQDSNSDIPGFETDLSLKHTETQLPPTPGNGQAHSQSGQPLLPRYRSRDGLHPLTDSAALAMMAHSPREVIPVHTFSPLRQLRLSIQRLDKLPQDSPSREEEMKVLRILAHSLPGRPAFAEEAEERLSELYKTSEADYLKELADYTELAIECGYEMFNVHGILYFTQGEEEEEDLFPQQQQDQLNEWAKSVGEKVQALTPMFHSDPDPEPPVVEVVNETSELSAEEQDERTQLEQRVDHGLYSAWSALREIRDRRLYRPLNWEEYCLQRFGFKRANANLKIFASKVYDKLSEADLATNSSHHKLLPINEQQVRAMQVLDEEEWVDVWEEGCKRSGGEKPPTGKIIKDIVQEIKDRTAGITRPSFATSEVIQLSGVGKYSGCWGIIQHVGEFSLTVQVWDSDDLQIKFDQANKVDDQIAWDNVYAISQWCITLRNVQDKFIESIVQTMGRQYFLTEFQQKILQLAEEEFC